jgi:5-(carboxyamino)imidazole ribonucleotide synthase
MTDQFEQQLRAILGLPLGSTDTLSPAAMVNILGAEGHFGTPVIHGLEQILAQPGVYVHWYGKQKTYPYRKMGHATVLDHDLATARARANQVREQLQIRGSLDD